MLCRERRPWTAKEDQLLRDAVEREDPDRQYPSRWRAIAEHVPDRTNKDCRKRWFVKMTQDVVKGSWSLEEDQRLIKGIAQYGTRWSLVAAAVQTRNNDQCAKRWTDTLNPAINRTMWSAEADELLLQAVDKHGKLWSKIVKTYFPGRTGLSVKNRYNSITRPTTRTPNRLPHLTCYKSESSSPSRSLESGAGPGQPPYSPADTNGSSMDFYLPNFLDVEADGIIQEDLASPPPPDPTSPCQYFVVAEDQVPRAFPGAISSDNEGFFPAQQGHDHTYSGISSISLYPRCSGVTADDDQNQFGSFNILSPQRYPQTGLHWEATVPVSHVNRDKVNDLVSRYF